MHNIDTFFEENEMKKLAALSTILGTSIITYFATKYFDNIGGVAIGILPAYIVATYWPKFISLNTFKVAFATCLCTVFATYPL